MNNDSINQFQRLISLIGEEKFKLLSNKKILVVGLGGVGGYVVESLSRSGVTNIAIVDFDTIDITNLNRQIIALHSTIGKKKVDVLEERIKDINPLCNVEKYDLFLDEENKDIVLENDFDFIIDCCDSIKTKKLLIDYATKYDIDFISSMGTANKMDPTKLEIVDIKKTYNDPLARIIRKYVKDKKITKKIMVLSSSEVPQKNGSILASNSFVPSTAGLIISSYVIKMLIK